jgi:hypothetical protein
VKAIWLVPPIVESYVSGDDPERSVLACRLASARLRMGVAALEWKRSNNENVFWNPGAAGAGQRVDWNSAKICVVPKFFYDVPLRPWLDACLAAKSHGCRLVIDICDYPFKKPPPVPEFYSKILRTCDAVVVNSERMAELMAPHTARRPQIIEDAILGSMGEPAFAPGVKLELLWFGHPTNLRYLDAVIEPLTRFALQRRCRLTVVTESSADLARGIQAINARFAPAFTAQLVPWSLETQRGALQECQLVLIPSDPADAFKSGASANRIAEALNAGRFPVASPLPSYLPFSEAAWVGQDLVQGIEWALANRDEVIARIRRGQAMVSAKFAAERVGRQWRELFERLVTSPKH